MTADRKKKHILALFLVLTLISLTAAEKILNFKTTHGIAQSRAMYAQPEKTIDVAFIGSSHVHCDINTALLWERYGIAGYDYSAAEQPLWITYYYLKELCKHQRPKLVVLDLYSPARFKDDYQYTFLNDNVLGMKFSLNKLCMLSKACESSSIFEFFPSLSVCHSRYDDLTAEDFKALLPDKRLESFKGYTPYFNTEPQERPALTQKSSGGLTAKSEKYLMKIIDYAKAHDIKLYLIVTPYITTSEDETVYNRIKQIAKDNSIEFSSFNYDYDYIGLDFATDFNDASHLNYSGSCKFSEYLAKEILKRFQITDRRGNDHYESWNRNVDTIKQCVESHTQPLVN